MVTLSDVVSGIGLAVVGGVVLAGRIASAGGADTSLPQGPVLLWAVAGVLLAVGLALLSVRTR